MFRFRVTIYTKDKSVSWNVPYLSWSVSEELNNDRNGQFSFAYEHLFRVAESRNTTVLNIIYGSLRWVEVYRINDETNEEILLYSGYLTSPTKSRGVSDRGTYQVGSKGIFSLLDRRLTNNPTTRPDETFFASSDLSDIAWDLINYTQNRTYGDLGITRGLDPTTRNAQRTYFYNPIGEAINDMSNQNRKDGFDFEIDVFNKFNVWYPFRGSDNGVTFIDGSDSFTYSGLVRPSVEDLVNNGVCKSSQGMGEGSLVGYSSGSVDSKNAYGLLEEVISDSANQLSTVQEKADRLVLDHQDTFISMNITVDGNKNSKWESINVGDFVTVVIPDEEINGTFRVYSRSINHENQETYNLSEDINT